MRLATSSGIPIRPIGKLATRACHQILVCLLAHSSSKIDIRAHEAGHDHVRPDTPRAELNSDGPSEGFNCSFRRRIYGRDWGLCARAEPTFTIAPPSSCQFCNATDVANIVLRVFTAKSLFTCGEGFKPRKARTLSSSGSKPADGGQRGIML